MNTQTPPKHHIKVSVHASLGVFCALLSALPTRMVDRVTISDGKGAETEGRGKPERASSNEKVASSTSYGRTDGALAFNRRLIKSDN